MLIIKRIIRYILRIYYILRSRNNHVYIHPTVLLNNHTVLAGYNKVHAKACITNSVLGRNTYIGKYSYSRDGFDSEKNAYFEFVGKRCFA